MDLDIATVSSKGQIVIPKRLRKGFKKGDKVLLARKDDMIFMRHARKSEEQLAEDLEFARRTRAALDEYERHPERFQEMDADEFLRELKKW